MAATTTSGTTGWNCVGFGSEYRWTVWNGAANASGVANSLDEGRAKAALASEILSRPKGDA